MKTMRREKTFPHFFSSLSHIKMNVVPDYTYYFPLMQPGTTHFYTKFGEKLGINWEEKI
jgi:hypothetical protein